MHDLYVLTKIKILPLKLWQYTEVLAVAPYVLSLYTSRLLLILSYVNGVSVPAEESQYVYLYPKMIIAWKLVAIIYLAT